MKEADLLEISWNHQVGYLDGTEHNGILVNLDMEGNLQGLQIEGATQLGDDLLKIRIPAPEKIEESQKTRPQTGQRIDAERIMKISYIKEADLLEVSWEHNMGYLDGTEHDRVLANMDMGGNLQGFQIHGVTKLKDDVLKIRVPSLEKAEKPQKSRP